MANTCIRADRDFQEIFSDLSTTVAYYPVQKTEDSVTGDEISTYNNTFNQSVIFFRNDTRYLFDKEGLVEMGDAYLLVPISYEPKRYDQFKVDNKTYQVNSVILRRVMNTDMFYYCVCMLVGNP